MTLTSPPSIRPVDILPLLTFTPPTKRIVLLFLSSFIFLTLMGTSLTLLAIMNAYAMGDGIQNLLYPITSISMILAIVFWRVHANRGREYLDTYRAGLKSVPQAILIRATHSPELSPVSRRAIVEYLNHRDPGWSLTEEAQRDGVLPMPEIKDTSLEKILELMKSFISPKS